MELNRAADQWRKCDPKSMAKMSEAAIMYALTDARSDVLLMHAEIERLRAALERIERWHGEFPETGRYWDEPTNTRPMSYAACYGSNGERDYMRQVARNALVAKPSERPQPDSDTLRDADASSKVEGAAAVLKEVLANYPMETLATWYCELNSLRWPDGFPIQKPEGFDGMNNLQRRNLSQMREAFYAVDYAVPGKDKSRAWHKGGYFGEPKTDEQFEEWWRSTGRAA